MTLAIAIAVLLLAALVVVMARFIGYRDAIEYVLLSLAASALVGLTTLWVMA